jgi:class 3 adenylate cyclase
MTKGTGKALTLRKTVTIAILFADIARSTQLYELLGDKQAQAQISSWLAALSKITAKFKGRVIKTIGDEVLCTFPDVKHAVEAGKSMHQALDQMPVAGKAGIGSPNIYVGIHYGKVIVDGTDIFGDAVNIASRTVGLAKQRQILLTEQAVSNMGSYAKNQVTYVESAIVKGKYEELKIYEYIWEKLDLTMVIDSSVDVKLSATCLELKSRDYITIVDQTHPAVTIGRQSHNDFILKNKRVSRSHARIEYRWGRYIYIDQSSNGTIVIDLNGAKRFVRRNEITLKGSGKLCFGIEGDQDATEIITYAFKG